MGTCKPYPQEDVPNPNYKNPGPVRLPPDFKRARVQPGAPGRDIKSFKSMDAYWRAKGMKTPLNYAVGTQRPATRPPAPNLPTSKPALASVVSWPTGQGYHNKRSSDSTRSVTSTQPVPPAQTVSSTQPVTSTRSMPPDRPGPSARPLPAPVPFASQAEEMAEGITMSPPSSALTDLTTPLVVPPPLQNTASSRRTSCCRHHQNLIVPCHRSPRH